MMSNKYKELEKILPQEMKSALTNAKFSYERVQEIRLRVNQPVSIWMDNKEYILTRQGVLSGSIKEALYIEAETLQLCFEQMSKYSLYAYEEEIKQGFVTIQGGHRIGVAGRVIVENGQIIKMNHISFMNVRLSHEIIGCGKKTATFLANGDRIHNTLIISPPGCGKTTLLRDLIRMISNGEADFIGSNVGVVDERSEIAACYQGIPQNEVGARTDVLDGCPKVYGMNMLVRSMSPKVIAVDEIGTVEDAKMLQHIMTCGCNILATAHGDNLQDMQKRPAFKDIMEQKMFDRFILLKHANHPGTVEGIYDSDNRKII